MNIGEFYEQISENITEFNKYAKSGEMDDYDAYAYEYEAICKGYMESYMNSDNVEASTTILYQLNDKTASGFETHFSYTENDVKKYVSISCTPDEDNKNIINLKYSDNSFDSEKNDFDESSPYDFQLGISDEGIIEIEARAKSYDLLQEIVEVSDCEYDDILDTYYMWLDEPLDDISEILDIYNENNNDVINDEDDDWNDSDPIE